MTGNVTLPSDDDVGGYINTVEHNRRRADAERLLPLFNTWTGMKPVLWTNGLAGKPGSAIIGYGHYHYNYKSGREGDWFLSGFSPRKQNLAIYIMPGFNSYSEQLEKLGPHKHSVSCLYLTNLEKNDLSALETIVRDSVKTMKDRYSWRAS